MPRYSGMRRLLLALTAALLTFAVPASAAWPPWARQIVSEDPVDWTPHVLDGQVRGMALVGDTVVVGGDFTSVTDSTGTEQFERWYLFAFHAGTGEVLDFAPFLDGPVLCLEPGPGNTVYVGGRFRFADDRPQRGIAQFDLATGRIIGTFAASLRWGDVRSIALAADGLYVGGSFEQVNGVDRVGLARLDPVTGTVDPRFDARLSAPEIGRVKVEDLAISPSGDRLVIIGAITMSGNQYRVQAAMFDLTRPEAQLADWWTDAYNAECSPGFDTYLRAVDFSPDGDYLVMVTTGQRTDTNLLCDTATRFETYAVGPVEPTWVNFTGGDSLYAVEITEDAVYVGGHQRWMDNPYGHETAGPGATDCAGLAAIDPITGRSNGWSPQRTRGVGVRALVLTGHGLFVGSDTDELSGEYHGRLGLFPH